MNDEQLCPDTREAYARMNKVEGSKPTRDWKYMSRILDSILDVWVKKPEMSLGELLDTAVSEHSIDSRGVYNVSDSELVTLVKAL